MGNINNYNNILSVENLTFTYINGKIRKKALDNISFQVKLGACTGILGPNGAGKSTLFSLLTTPQKGEKTGKIIKNTIPGLVPQEYAFYPHLTPLENLKFFSQFSNKKEQSDLDKILNDVGLSEQKNIMAKTFSGGMKRKLNLAIALINNPKLLILDEPTVGVDVISRPQIWKILKNLQNQGHTLLLASHQFDEISHMCDFIIHLKEGKITKESYS